MTCRELYLTRQSCRNYDERPVEEDKLKEILSLAALAPSACNSQPWHFTLIPNPEKAHEVAKCVSDAVMNRYAAKVPAFIVISERKATLSEKIASKITSQHFAQIDIGIVTAHLTLAAAEMGVATTILGWFYEDKLRAAVGLPDDLTPRLVIALGYAAESDPLRSKKRRPLDESLTIVK